MSEHARVCTPAQVECLDLAEVSAGYDMGAAGAPEPHPHFCTRSFWHGWRNGAVDAGLIERDDAQEHLCRLWDEATRYIH